ncbi:MAG: Holliday junction branch migration protein RuvA [Patescibacteria group bacterium]
MIGRLRGQVVGKSERTVTLEVGGVGYKVNLPADTLAQAKVGRELTLHTHLAVRDDALDLYGFETEESLTYFHLLLTVPGIGPKSALATLSVAAPAVLRQAITRADTSYLTRVSGIGQKNAEKIVMTLKDKLAPAAGAPGEAEAGFAVEAEALEGLKSLGYSAAEARQALKQIDLPRAEATSSSLIKAALKNLSTQNK